MSKLQAEPTPLPWRVEPFSKNEDIIITNANGLKSLALVYQHYNTDAEELEAAANAAFIVTAVNAHAALVVALKETVDVLGHNASPAITENAIMQALSALELAGRVALIERYT